MKIIILSFLLISFLLIFCKNIPNIEKYGKDDKNDSIKYAYFVPEYEYLEIEKPKDNFITRLFKFYNKGNIELNIHKVEASCGCSNATVLASNIAPSDSGSFYLSINLKGLYDDRNIVEYKIFSNSINSPSVFRIKIKETEIKDTLE